MYQTIVYNAVDRPSAIEKEQIVCFLHEHLGAYGDSKSDIRKALSYALKEFVSFGGFILVMMDQDRIVGAVVVNQTGMGGYIPENILVYIASHKDERGKGIGKELMRRTIQMVKGDVALHVEPNNPAKKLYEKFGFENPYLEMRLKQA